MTTLALPGKITDASFVAIAEHAALKARLESSVVVVVVVVVLVAIAFCFGAQIWL